MQDNIKIFLSYHKPSTLLKSEIFAPIHVGRELAKKDSVNYQWMLDNMIGDNTGDNISEKNPNYCELTAQYWAWKNVDCDYIGFMHYRRHLNFNLEKKYDESCWGLSEEEYLNLLYIDKYGLNDENLKQVIPQYDIITVNPWDVKNAGSKNNYNHYKTADAKLHIEDYDKALNILINKYPDYKEDIEKYNNSELGYYTNIFVMKKSLFNDYCNWLFGILFELEKQTDISNYDYQEARIYGYISEWLFGIYMTHLKRTTDLKVKELQRTVVNNTDIIQDSNNINICFATDNENNYLQHLGVAIASILKNTQTKKTIDIYLLNSGKIKKKDIKKIKQVTKIKENVNLYPVKIDKQIFDNFFMLPNSHFALATYYRFIIPSMLNNLSKLIYLDCDLVVKDDIENLYNIDLDDYYVAGVQDLIGRCNQQRLKLDKTNYYINAGVLLMNLEKMRKEDVSNKLIKCSIEKKDEIYWLDQDILNIVMEGKIKYLDLAWNLQYFYPGEKVDYEPEVFKKALENPKIIHFIGHIKPWDILSNRPNEKEYFKYLKYTPWKNFAIKHSILSFIKSMYNIQKTTKYKYFSILGIKIKHKRRPSIKDIINELNQLKAKQEQLYEIVENLSKEKEVSNLIN